MALIGKKLVTERETASYKLNRKTIELVKYYSEFIGSPQEHVVNEALLFIFRKDRDFNEWLTQNKKVSDLTTAQVESKGSNGRAADNGNKA